MDKRSIIWGLAGSVVVESSDSTLQVVSQTSSTEVAQMNRFTASVATFNLLGEKAMELEQRIARGVDYCRQHPSDSKAFAWLKRYRAELADIERRMKEEAELQYDIERQVCKVPDEYICSRCCKVRSQACDCLSRGAA